MESRLLSQMIRKVSDHARHHGWMVTLTVIIKNIRFQLRRIIERHFDRKYRVDTAGRVNLQDLLIESKNREQGVYYEPTPQKVFHKIFSKLDIEYQEFEFVDFGCGKGRALILAARYPFRRVTGVEFAPELVEVARCNLMSYIDEHQQCRKLEILCMDATQYEIPDDKAILYFFNPFSATVTEVIAQNIRTSFLRNGSKKYVVYYHPQSAHVFEKLPFLKKVASKKKLVDLAGPQLRGFVIFETIDEWTEP